MGQKDKCIKNIFIYLRDVHHVSHEGKAFQFELGDVCLKQHIYLSNGHKKRMVK